MLIIMLYLLLYEAKCTQGFEERNSCILLIRLDLALAISLRALASFDELLVCSTI